MATGDDKPLELPVPVPARKKGVSFYRVQASRGRRGERQEAGRRADRGTSEQTLANNSRLVVVDQGGGPYRVLYVERPAQLGVQVPPPGPRRRRAGPARRPAPDRPAPAEVRLPQPGAPQTIAPLRRASTIPTPTRPSGPISRSWSASALATRSSCATASPRRPTSSTATTRSSSTTSRPPSSPRTSSPSCGTS